MKRWILIGGIAVVVQLTAAAGGLYYTGKLDPLLGRGAKTVAAVASAAERAAPDADLFYDLPEMQVTLPASERDVVVRMVISLECPGQSDLAALRAYVPRVLDVVQVYVRGLTLKDLRGVANLEKLRHALIDRIDLAIAPGQVRNLLFREIVIE